MSTTLLGLIFHLLTPGHQSGVVLLKLMVLPCCKNNAGEKRISPIMSSLPHMSGHMFLFPATKLQLLSVAFGDISQRESCIQTDFCLGSTSLITSFLDMKYSGLAGGVRPANLALLKGSMGHFKSIFTDTQLI